QGKQEYGRERELLTTCLLCNCERLIGSLGHLFDAMRKEQHGGESIQSDRLLFQFAGCLDLFQHPLVVIDRLVKPAQSHVDTATLLVERDQSICLAIAKFARKI